MHGSSISTSACGHKKCPPQLHLSMIGRHFLTEKRCHSRSINSCADQPWRCLCLGFSQIIMILPFLLMTLHFSQIGFTDDLTFMALPPFQKRPFYILAHGLFYCKLFFIKSFHGRNKAPHAVCRRQNRPWICSLRGKYPSFRRMRICP